ncbi:hypothetical protein lerEdw1_003125 [Lerista edwardsae]|nr:hypothetical protein lerEdw1_003125 [Lerista edwardsae]
MEKRVASSIFITLAPPRRDPLAKGEGRPTGALHLPRSSPHQEALTPAGPFPPQTSAKVTRGGRGHSSGETGLPSGGCPSVLPHSRADSGLTVLLPPPTSPEAPPAPFSVETLGPGLEKQVEALQPLSRVPAEARPTPLLPTDLRPAGELQAERRHMEAATAATPTGEDPLPASCQEPTDRSRDTGPPMAPRLLPPDICAFCHKALSPRAPAIEAMNKQYHAGCFTCRRCHCALAGQRFYQKEGRPLCVGCYKSTLEKCARCQALILDHLVRAVGSAYHPECFTCVACGRSIGDEAFAVDAEAGVHCLPDFYRKCASVCCACEQPIVPSQGRDSYRIECLGQHFHEDCYRCEVCRVRLSPEPTEGGCFPLGLRLLCKACHLQQVSR